jgi:hypothetical protein
VTGIGAVRLRWIGHQFRAECEITVDASRTVGQVHAIAADAEHRLIHAIPLAATGVLGLATVVFIHEFAEVVVIATDDQVSGRLIHRSRTAVSMAGMSSMWSTAPRPMFSRAAYWAELLRRNTIQGGMVNLERYRQAQPVPYVSLVLPLPLQCP